MDYYRILNICKITAYELSIVEINTNAQQILEQVYLLESMKSSGIL